MENLAETPELIESLKENEVFVYGSNLMGIHGAGAAKIAQEKFGSKNRVGFGLQGQSFAIPTKYSPWESLPLEDIAYHVNRFLSFAKENKDKKFLITKIGCGFAGFSVEQIAPLFVDFLELKNCTLPKEFIECLRSLDGKIADL